MTFYLDEINSILDTVIDALQIPSERLSLRRLNAVGNLIGEALEYTSRLTPLQRYQVNDTIRQLIDVIDNGIDAWKEGQVGGNRIDSIGGHTVDKWEEISHDLIILQRNLGQVPDRPPLPDINTAPPSPSSSLSGSGFQSASKILLYKKPKSKELIISGGALDFTKALHYGKKAVDLAIKGSKKAEEFYKHQYTKDLLNALPKSNPHARPQYKNEMHTVLKLPNGKIGIANYTGQNTNLRLRLKNGDPPVSLVDAVSMLHDCQYELARQIKDKKERYQAVVNADKLYLDLLNKIENKENKNNIKLVRTLLLSKTIADQTGFLDIDKFASYSPLTNPEINMIKTYEKLLLDFFEA